MKTTITLLFILTFPILLMGQNSITDEDLTKITGHWTGTLTYVDYSSGNPFTMPANVTIRKKNNKLLLANEYPNEPKANGTDTIKISKDRTRINKHQIISRRELENGTIEIMTSYLGKDNNKDASIRNLYCFGKDQLILRKEVKFEGESEWLKRSEFNYQRKN